MAHVVEVASTPNPNARKFLVGSRLVGGGTYEYADREQALAESPLAAALFAVEGVDGVMIAPDFVTVEKAPTADWGLLEDRVTREVAAFLDSYQMAVLNERDTAAGAAPTNEVEARIVRLLDEEIRPAIAMDGGEVTFMGFTDGIVRLRLSGACGTCPSAVTTLKMGIERLLVEEIPEVRAVEQVP